MFNIDIETIFLFLSELRKKYKLVEVMYYKLNSNVIRNTLRMLKSMTFECDINVQLKAVYLPSHLSPWRKRP